MLLICLFLASEARRVLFTLLGLDGMGLNVMMSMVKLLLKGIGYSRDALAAAKPPKVNSKELPTEMYIYVITSLVRGF